MKKVLVLIAFVLITVHSFAQKAVDKGIQATIIRLFDGMSNLDDQAIRSTVTADFTLLEGGLVWNADTLINHLLPLRKMNVKRLNKFEFLTTEQNKEVAWISYFNTADFIINDKQRSIRWLESAVLINKNGIWKIQLLHSTVVKQ